MLKLVAITLSLLFATTCFAQQSPILIRDLDDRNQTQGNCFAIRDDDKRRLCFCQCHLIRDPDTRRFCFAICPKK